MATVIKLKKSESALTKPSTSDIVVGEVAINALDQRVFVRDSNDNIVTIGEAGGLRHESSTVTYTVTVASKNSTHRYNGTGSSNGYKIDGSFSPTLKLVPGNTYRFDQSDSTNSGHPLRFYYEANKTTSYTTDVTTNGTAGSVGAYTEITITDSTPSVLHYQCSVHGYMGNQVITNTRNLTGFDTDDLTEGSNLYYTDARVDARITKSAIDALNINADTLDNQDGTYYLNYNNFSNTPTIPSDVSDLTDTTGTIPTSLTDLNITDGTNGQILSTDGNGNFSFVNDAGGIALTDLSIGSEATPSGDGNLAYNNTTGEFTFTPPVLSGLSGDTDDISEGSTNLYFTDARADARISAASIDDLSDVDTTGVANGKILKYNSTTNKFEIADDATGAGGSGNTFSTIAVSGQSDVVADSSTDTLTFEDGGLIGITTNATTDTVTFTTPTAIPFTKSDGSSSNLEMQVSAGTLSTAVSNLFVPFTKSDGTDVSTLILS